MNQISEPLPALQRRTPRVCILTAGPIGSNPRVVKEADALHEAGFDVTVISTRTLDLVDRRDNALLKRAAWKSQRVDLRRNMNWKVARVLQLAARHASKMIGTARLANIAFSAFTPALYPAAMATPADLYIAHYPAALPVAAAAARQHGALFAFDAEDFHLGDWPDDPVHDRDRLLLRAIEQRYLPRCAYVTAASPEIAGAYVDHYGIKKPTVILNVFPLNQMPAGVPTASGTATPNPSIYWFSQTIGPGRGLECAVRAIGRAQTRPHLFLRGSLATGFADRLTTLAAEAGATDRVHFLEPLNPDDMERLAANYDLGLCGEPGHTRNNSLALSNKLFSYLLAGVPPLLSSTRAHLAFATEADLAQNIFTMDDTDALATLIDHFLAVPERLAEARAQAHQLAIKRFNWDLEKQSLVTSVKTLICFMDNHAN